MDDGTLKTPIPKCRLYWSFFLEWCINFVGSESGQKQSAKLLQNMVYPPPPHSHTLSVYTVSFTLGRGRGQREGRGHKRGHLSIAATVHKLGQKYQLWLNVSPVYKICQTHAAKSGNRSILKKSRHLGFGVFLVHSSMVRDEISMLEFKSWMLLRGNTTSKQNLEHFFFRETLRNKIPKVWFYFCWKNGIPSCFLFCEMLLNKISKFCFYCYSKVRNSERFFLSAERFGIEFREFSVPRNRRNFVGNNHLFRIYLPRNNFFVGNCQP